MQSIIRVALAGIGNCASNLIQGLELYRKNPDYSLGLSNRVKGGYDVSDIEIVAAFDIAENKVGKDISEAIFATPNCTQVISDVPLKNVTVQKGPVMDGWDECFDGYFNVSQEPEVDVEHILKERKVDVLVIMIPTGSEKACYAYIKAALNAGVNVINGIPVLATHDKEIIDLAIKNKVNIIGDDFKSQIGGTILHHALLTLLKQRGVKVEKSYQLNYAGNMDFKNLVTKRGNNKHASKKRGIKAGGNEDLDLEVNVSYIENQGDTKTCEIYIEGCNFGGCSVRLKSELSVVDSANSSGVIVDAIRCSIVAKRKGIYGRVRSASGYYMKSPYEQIDDNTAYNMIEELLKL